jgi:3-phosphoshikimate 1-carboxyvinyltransferase
MTVIKKTQTRPCTSHKVEALHGDVQVPGDKSISHRALMLASQIIGSTRISGLLESEDVLCTGAALQAMGVQIKREGSDWKVTGVGVGGLSESESVLEMGNSGTSTRLLMGLVAAHPFTSFMAGDASLSRRPMQRIMGPLREMGAEFISRSEGRLPLAVIGSRDLRPIRYRLPVASAQVKSGILLAGLNTAGITEVVEPEPSRDHTERMLPFFGIRCEVGEEGGARVVRIAGHQNPHHASPLHCRVPGDPSSAAFVIVATLITPHAEVTLRNICINPLRIGLITSLREMGADIAYENERMEGGEPVADLRVRSSRLRGVTIPAERAPSMIDEYPILAVAAAYAEGRTRMLGLTELRVKESDRLTAIAQGLEACGVTVRVEGDTLEVTGSTKIPGGATIAARLDHRIAMSFLVLGMRSESAVSVDDIRSIDTSFPGFVEMMNRLGASMHSPASEEEPAMPSLLRLRSETRPLVIAIDGPAASGKGTLARRLADHYGLAYLDTGKLYRVVGMKLVYANQDPLDTAAALQAAQNIALHDLTNPRLSQERIGQAASIVSAIPEVRAALLQFQRDVAARPQGAVLDGRDIGTVVCPDADIKLFVTAQIDARAKRRHRELQGQGIEVVYDSVRKDLEARDARDSSRSVAPLTAAPDALLLDTTDLEAEDVFAQVVRWVDARLGG